MFNKILTLILLLSIHLSISAQTLLKGKISDSNGQPLVGVQVFTLDITLVESPLTLKEITVVAGFVEEKEALPYPIETIMKKEIISSGSVNLSQALARTPGVYFSSFGNGVGKPVIRGLTNANIILLNNGAKLENFNFSSAHPFLVDEFSANRVEVLKGAASLQYGSDAVGGVVNIIRERPAQPQSIEGDFISHYNSNTNGYMNSLGIKGSNKTFFFGLRGSIKSHEDFTDGNGDVVNNTRFNENNISANLGARTNFGIFSLNYNYTDAEYGLQNRNQINLFSNPVAVPLLTQDRENQVWYQNLDNHIFSSNNTIFLGKNTLEINLAYQQNTRQGIGGGVNPMQQLMSPTFASMQLNTFTYNAKMLMPIGNHNFIFGVNGANIQNEADETKPNNPLLDSEINDLGIYAIGNFSLLEKLNLTGGLRYDYRVMQSSPAPTQTTNRFEIDNTYNVLNGSVGITYNLGASQFLKINVSKGFRSPTVPELTQNGIHAGRYERGNPDLKAQDNFQFDLNYHFHNSWITFDVTPFYNIISNYTYLVTTSEDAPIGGGKIFQHIQNDANLYGGEAVLNIHPYKFLDIKGSYSLVRADITDGAEGIEHPTFIPQDRITGKVKFEQEKLAFLRHSYLAIEVIHFLEQNRTGQNEAITPAYTLLNARIGTSIALGGQDLDIFIIGNNLANTVYIDHLSVTKQLNLNMMGRNVMFGLRLPFGFEKSSR